MVPAESSCWPGITIPCLPFHFPSVLEMQLLKGLFSPNAAETLRGWRFPLSLNIFFPFSWRGRWLYLSPIQTAVALIYPFVITSYPMLFTNENLSRSFWLVETSSPSQHSVPGQRLIFLHIWTCLLHIPAATNSPISLLSSGLFPSVPFQGQTDLDSL